VAIGNHCRADRALLLGQAGTSQVAIGNHCRADRALLLGQNQVAWCGSTVVLAGHCCLFCWDFSWDFSSGAVPLLRLLGTAVWDFSRDFSSGVWFHCCACRALCWDFSWDFSSGVCGSTAVLAGHFVGTSRGTSRGTSQVVCGSTPSESGTPR
jgi:hypothetical protein